MKKTRMDITKNRAKKKEKKKQRLLKNMAGAWPCWCRGGLLGDLVIS